MKHLLSIILFLSLNAEIKSQNTILEELYSVDPPFNQEFQVDYFTVVNKSFAKKVVTPGFINPHFESFPLRYFRCKCKNNVVVDCDSNTKGSFLETYHYDYDNKYKTVGIKSNNGLNTAFVLEYDSLSRPIYVFRKHEGKMLLYELAIYEDTTVNIATFNPEGEVVIKKEYPYILGQSKHIKKVKHEKNNKKVIIHTIDPDYPNREWRMVYKLDEKLNWIKVVRYQTVGYKEFPRAKVIRKIYYK